MSEPVNLQLEYRDGCLVIRTHGRDLFERMPVTMQAIAAAIRARPVRATLIDVRAVPGSVTFLDRYQMGNMAARHLPRVLLAVLMREDQADPKRIGQLAAQNRGVNAEVFTDPAQAEAWLKNAPPLGSTPPVAP